MSLLESCLRRNVLRNTRQSWLRNGWTPLRSLQIQVWLEPKLRLRTRLLLNFAGWLLTSKSRSASAASSPRSSAAAFSMRHLSSQETATLSRKPLSNIEVHGIFGRVSQRKQKAFTFRTLPLVPAPFNVETGSIAWWPSMKTSPRCRSVSSPHPAPRNRGTLLSRPNGSCRPSASRSLFSTRLQPASFRESLEIAVSVPPNSVHSLTLRLSYRHVN